MHIPLALLVLLLALESAYAQAPAIYCNNQYATSGLSGPVAQTKIVSGAPGKIVSVCGWNIANTGGAAVTITFQGGSGTNCGTATAASGLGVTVANGQQNIDHLASSIASLITGHDLCWTITGTGTVNATIYFAIN